MYSDPMTREQLAEMVAEGGGHEGRPAAGPHRVHSTAKGARPNGRKARVR